MKVSINKKYSINEIFNYIKENSKFSAKDIQNIICHLYKININDVILNKNQIFNLDKKMISKIIKNYPNRIPLQYITNSVYFIDQFLYIKKPILIPRPETEELVIHAMNKLDELNHSPRNILDIGTGCGAIANHLAKKFPNAQVIAIDKSKGAIEVSKRNLEPHKNAHCIRIDINNYLNNKQNLKRFNLIISNPPYISYREILDVSYQTLKYESKRALFAKNNGLFFYKLFFAKLENILEEKFLIVLEIGYKNKNEIMHLLEESLFFHKCNYDILKDSSNKDRILMIWK